MGLAGMAVKLVAGLLKDYDRDPPIVPLSTRVVGALAVIKSPVVQAFGYTSLLGNRLRLRKVRVWFMPVWTGPVDWVDFWVRFGTGIPVSYAAVRDWEDLLPINWIGSTPMGYRELGTGKVFEWTMDRLFSYDGIRFAIQVECTALITYEEMYATFEIAEV
jgi:hypothetical protein